MADVFVSYSRQDSEFVRRLIDSMSARGKEAWVNTEGIADGEVFPEAIKQAIEQSDSFMFVITPAAVRSRYCETEVEYARELNKRIVPVLRGPVDDVELPAEIRDRSWIPFTESAQFEPSLERLVRALDTDLDALRAHTRWLVKALEWNNGGRDGSLLLRGSELRSAEGWLAASSADADPAPTVLQREYLLASRAAAVRRQRTLAGASLAVAAISIGLLIFALISRGQAVSERVGARAQALAAESQAQLPNDPEISLILGMRAVREKPTAQTEFALRAALDATSLERGLPTIDDPGTCGLNSGLSGAYRPDGRQVALVTCTGSLRLIDPASGRVTVSKPIGAGVSSLAYSPDGALLALGTETGVTLVDPLTGGVRARLTGLSGTSATGLSGTSSIAFSPDGRLLAASSPLGISLWSLPGLRRRTLVRDSAEGGGLVFGHDGSLIISGGTDASVHVYDVANGRLLRRIIAPGNPGLGLAGPGSSWPEVVALSRDGGQLAVGYPTDEGANGEVSLYDTKTWVRGADVLSLPDVEISALAFSPDGSRLAIGGEDGTAGVWSLSTGEQVVAYDGPTAAVAGMAFAPDGQTLLATSDDGIARLWRALGAEESFFTFPGDINDVIVQDDVLDVVHVFHGRTTLSSLRLPGGEPVANRALGRLTALRFSPDGRYMLVAAGAGGPNGPVSVETVATGTVLRRLGAALALGLSAFSPDGSRVALVEGATTWSTGNKLVVVTVATGRTVTLPLPGGCAGDLRYLAFSRDDARLAGASFCGYADVWDTATGKLLRQVYEGGEVSGVDLNPDGSRLLVSSWDSRATIWEVSSGRALINLIGHTRGISTAAFSPDGSLVVTCGLDHTVRVWDAATGQQLRVLTFTVNQQQTAFSPDGQRMAIVEGNFTGTGENAVTVFGTCPACEDPRALLALAAPHATTQLTTLERTVVDGA